MTHPLEQLAAKIEGLEDFETPEAVAINNALHDLLPEPKCVQPPNYLRSIDAAMQLVPDGAHWGMGHDNTGPLAGWAWVRVKGKDGWQELHSPLRMGFNYAGPFPAAPSLALCAAALRARAAMED